MLINCIMNCCVYISGDIVFIIFTKILLSALYEYIVNSQI
nr:hypothetical protein [Providencia rettgeri]